MIQNLQKNPDLDQNLITSNFVHAQPVHESHQRSQFLSTSANKQRINGQIHLHNIWQTLAELNKIRMAERQHKRNTSSNVVLINKVQMILRVIVCS